MPHPGRHRSLPARIAEAFGILILLLARADAQLPQPRLTTVFPAGARVGETLEVAITGSDLDDPAALLFEDARITSEAVPGSPLTFRVSLPSALAPGLTELRFAGRFGVSNPRAFYLSPPGPPEPRVPAGNTSPDTAFELALDTPVHGRVATAQSHWFRFRAEAGQRIVAQVLSRALDSRLVPDLTVLDDAGHELAVARRTGTLDFTAPAAGIHRLRLHDQTFRGGDEYLYRLSLETRPVIEFTVPPVIHRESTHTWLVFGRNLRDSRPGPIPGSDGRRLDVCERPVPEGAGRSDERTASAPLHPRSHRRPPDLVFAPSLDFEVLPLTLDPQARLTVPVGVSPKPITLLSPGIGTATASGEVSPTVLTPPAEIAGVFGSRQAPATFDFKGQKGQVWWLEVSSERLGFSADPRAVVQRVGKDDAGREKLSDVAELNDLETNLGARDFDTTSRDCVGRLALPEDGTYRVTLRNLFDGGPTGGRVPFWVSLRLETPDFRLAVYPQAQPRLNDADRQVHLWTPVLRRGETQPLRVVAFRRDGFEGEIELTVSNLPPGVVAAPARLAPGQSSTSILLTADAKAAAGHAPMVIHGRARIGSQELQRPATPASLVWHVPDWDQERASSRRTAQMQVSVCAVETAPITVVPSPPPAFPWKAAVGAKVSIPFQIQRQELFPAAFSLKLHGHPEAEKRKEIAIAEKATQGVLDLDLGETKLPPGRHTLWLQAMVPGKYRNNPEALAAAETALKTATDAVAAATSAEAKAAAEEKRKAAESARKAVEERAKPRDVSVAVYSQPIVLQVVPPPPTEPAK